MITRTNRLALAAMRDVTAIAERKARGTVVKTKSDVAIARKKSGNKRYF